jgi:hypothetical protein
VPGLSVVAVWVIGAVALFKRSLSICSALLLGWRQTGTLHIFPFPWHKGGALE